MPSPLHSLEFIRSVIYTKDDWNWFDFVFFRQFIAYYINIRSKYTDFYFFLYKQRYKDADIEVTRKDGIMLLREIATEVKNFMDFKMNAVMVSSLFFVIQFLFDLI